MDFLETTLNGAYLVRSNVIEDERGYFARVRCADEFAAHGLPSQFVQSSFSHNNAAGTFRGLHFQRPPSQEGKLVRCIAGAIDDVIVDIRPDSPTFLKHEWFHLSSKETVAFYIPPGFAHGFLTLENHSTLMYDMSDVYQPELSGGIRWSDRALNVRMPRPIETINSRDANYPDLELESLKCFRTALN